MRTSVKPLLAPEYVIESNGVACGDRLSLYAYQIDGLLFFSFYGDSCKVAKESADYLQKNLSGGNKEDIYKKVTKWSSDPGLVLDFPKERRECALMPIRLLLDLYENEENNTSGECANDALACDACVRMRRINWNSVGNKKRSKNRNTSEECFENETCNLQKYGLCVLDEKSQRDFSDALMQIDNKCFDLIKKLRLAAPLYNNSKKYKLKIDSKITELAIRQYVSEKVAETEIECISSFIKDNSLRICGVKGGRTGAYYSAGMIRAHMDFDYLCSNICDSAVLIHYLVNERGFKLVIGGSVPFSFKTVFDELGVEQLTGHIHLEKILQDRYQVVVDINIGGFPLGRTGIIKFDNERSELEIEKLICITVAHLFKHEIAFIKDINDLFYLLEQDSVIEEKLLELLNRFDLMRYFEIAYAFIKENMGLKRIYHVDDYGKHLYDGWPYSKNSHFEIKKRLLINKCVKQFGEEKGMKEAENQMEGEGGLLNSKAFSGLCEYLNTRTYLYPIVFFKKYINIDVGEFELISECLYERGDIAILPFGLFLKQKNEKTIRREKIEGEVEYILDVLGISIEECNFAYIMEARKDTWLY